MKAIKFELFGRNAHFKNPEVNKNIELSYDHIPKTNLLGMLGAVLGLKGLQQERELGYVEYLEELKDIKISIVPSKARWKKHIDEMNNSTGYANEKGSTQIIRRQMLEDVSWTIYILEDGIRKEYYDEILESLKNKSTVFPIFLGKTECKARIKEIEEVVLEEIAIGDIEKCDSLLLDRNIKEIEKDVNPEFNFEDELFIGKYYLPINYNEILLYKLEKIIFTNSYISIKDGTFYKEINKIINIF